MQTAAEGSLPQLKKKRSTTRIFRSPSYGPPRGTIVDTARYRICRPVPVCDPSRGRRVSGRFDLSLCRRSSFGLSSQLRSDRAVISQLL